MADKKIQKKKAREKRLKSERVKQSQMFDAESNMDLATDAYKAKDYKSALFYVNKVLNLKPDWSHALRLRAGIALKHEQDYAAAIPCILKLTRKNEDDANAIFSLANCYFQERRYADEIELLEKFLERLKNRRDRAAREDKDKAKAWIKESRKFIEAGRFISQPPPQPLSGRQRKPTLSPFPIPERASASSTLKAKASGTGLQTVTTPLPLTTPIPPALDLSPFTDPRNLHLKSPLLIKEAGMDFGEKIFATPPDALADYLLRLQYNRLRLVREFEELLCLEHLKGVKHYWYQVETAFNVLKRFRGRVLLADEVGLGKTIEAGMLIKEYLLRGLARKVLVLTPPTLVSQWQEEMAEKFDLPFVTPEHEDFREDGERFWREQDLVIASINTAKSQRHFEVITSIDYDLVVVDEAHYLRNKQTLNHRLVGAIRKRFIFLLSATPVQNNLMELYNLITLLQPGLLSTEAAFKKDYVKRGNLRQPNNPERLRQLLREVMIRNTRSMVDVKLPKRFATTFYVPPTEGEKETYGELSDCIRLFHETTTASELFTVRNLQMAAGSSPFALKESIRHLITRLAGSGAHVPIRAMFEEIERKLADIKTTSKGRQLLSLLQQNQEKKLIFVRYLQTLEYLAGLLKENGYHFAVFSGAMTASEKDAAVETFHRDVPILLSTETGGEGRNIQFCNTLINYDLPWNPMRLEQRIGRIHRIGQERDVFIFNLCLQGSIEDYMMRILDDKINMFELVIGEIDTILGNLETDRDFSSLILDVWLSSGADDERHANFARLGDEIIAAKKTYEQTKAMEEVIFGDDYEV
jgi:superfamily II DNA or RNA helicase/tetratricopeptide (TPR) repeat protein